MNLYCYCTNILENCDEDLVDLVWLFTGVIMGSDGTEDELNLKGTFHLFPKR